MYVIYFCIDGSIQLISWTSSLDTAKKKLKEYTLHHLRILDSGTVYNIDDGISTINDIDEIPDVEIPDAESVTKYYAKYIVGETNRHANNIRQINIYKNEVVSGWTTYIKKSKLIGYFAFSQVNQASNLQPSNNAELEEVQKDLEQEKILIMLSNKSQQTTQA